MILAVLIVNNHGMARLSKFYDNHNVGDQQRMVSDVFSRVSRRTAGMCNFVECGEVWGSKDAKIVYRHYATLYFVFVVDSTESELGILDLIHILVETLDKAFENVCELDLIFNLEKVHCILDEIVMGGLVLETSSQFVVKAVEDQRKMLRAEGSISNSTLNKGLKLVKMKK